MKNWKLSAGTASVIGKKIGKNMVLPTTAYVMLGEKCRNHCRFCAQSGESSARKDTLSRITWPKFPIEESQRALTAAYDRGDFKRICFQVVNSEDSWTDTLDALEEVSDAGRRPVCVSQYVKTLEQVGELLHRGADHVCLALDAATPDLYHQIKGGNFAERWQLLQASGKAFPGRITTHLIVGLGETEAAMIERIADCIALEITVALFAFTPVRGTEMADQPAPDLSQYRRIQIAHALLRLGYDRSCLLMEGNRLAAVAIGQWEGLLENGQAFETSGCPDCNRPFYNERPGGTMYNYPRPLTVVECQNAIAVSGLAEGKL